MSKQKDFKDFLYERPFTSVFLATTISSMIFKKIIDYFKNRISYKTVIEIDFTDLVQDSSNIFDKKGGFNLESLVNCIQSAATDDRVEGIICKFTEKVELLSYVSILQLREALAAFNLKKKSICFSELYTVKSYLLGSGFSKIFLLEKGTLFLTGNSLRTTFFKNALKKLLIIPKVYQREKYKNYGNTFTEEKFTKEHKEIFEQYLSSLVSTINIEISKSRNVTIDITQSWIDEGFITHQVALEKKLIDGHCSLAAVYEEAYKFIGVTEHNVSLLYNSVYYSRKGPLYSRIPSYLFLKRYKIAIINLEGSIHSGESSNSIGADTTIRTIRSAASDSFIDAILIRVNSGGGSVTASELICGEVLEAKKKGKKIVVFMDAVAASGGYYISMNADKIVASRATITGSIGVIALQMDFSNFLSDKLGVTFDEVQSSKSADFLSFLHPIVDGSSRDKKWIELIDTYYKEFKDSVATARKIDREKMDTFAQGKIYSGEDALAIGLIDHIGTFKTAISVTKTLLNIDENEHVELIEYPRKLSLFETISHYGNPPTNSKDKEKRGIPLFQASTQYFGVLNYFFNKVMKFFSFASFFNNNSNTAILSIIDTNNIIDEDEY